MSGRPCKGIRKPILLRLPIAEAERIEKLKLPDRNAWIVAAITEKLERPQDG